MGLAGLSPFKLLIVLALVLLLFGGKGRLSSLMSDMAAGLRNFRKGLRDPDGEDAPTPEPPPPARLSAPAASAGAPQQQRDA